MKETEKNNAHKVHTEAVNNFEKIARELYESLKKKEDTEAKLQQLINTEAKITLIRNQSEYIQSLSRHIDQLQTKVQNARKQMEEKQDLLTKAHIEEKKMETIINNRKEEKEAMAKKIDMNLMDEMALQQFFSLK